jgi:two-component system nitrate/nitrite response regulator NarL
MKIYYLYSKIKEVKAYILESLIDYELILIEHSADLFEIKDEDSLLLLHVDSYDQDRDELIKLLLKEKKELKILALSNRVNFREGTALLQAGVKGYGNVYMHSVILYQAVDVIMSDNVWIYPELAQHLIKNLTKSEFKDEHRVSTLSEHEKECALLVAEGKSNQDIATLLNLQLITIKKHLSSVYKKLNVKNRIELALFLK